MIAVLLVLVPVLAGGPQSSDTADDATQVVLDETLQEMLAAQDDTGAAILDGAQREYFEKLPTHSKQIFNQATTEERLTSAAQLREILALALPVEQLELLMRDGCALCHLDPEMQEPETLFSSSPESHGSPPHLNIAEFVSDVHFRKDLSCSGCHGGNSTDDFMADEIYERWPEREVRTVDRSWIPGFCSRCHSDPEFMRRYDPTLPTDQLDKYRTSLHGKRLLEEKDSNAAQCISCHGVHGIRGPKSPKSSVHPARVPSTCGKCHADPQHMAPYTLPDGSPMPTNQLELYRTSVHGQALLEKGDLGAPACNDCHGNHAAMPPEVASVAEVCRRCHAQNGELFDGSRHKAAFEQHKWPECGQCHQNHDIARPDYTLIGSEPGTLCHNCHAKFATKNPECDRAAADFRSTIDRLREERATIEELIEPTAERGLDVEPLVASVTKLDEVNKRLRSQIHTFDRSKFDLVAKEGDQAAQAAHATSQRLDDEYHFRQRGLLIAIAIMVLLAILIRLKLRQIERARDKQQRAA